MVLIHRKSGSKKEAIIEPVLSTDFERIKGDPNFTKFDWSKEQNYEVFKIRFIDSDDILGLISLIDYRDEKWIKINLLESSIENVGKGKEYDRIAGCLIAYACRIAFIRGYDGIVALKPKTVLQHHYMIKYGMVNAGKHLYTASKNSENLIQYYLV